MPKVSVLVPVYNVERYISRCLESLLRQTMYDIEIIVVDDCSPDSSMCIVKELASTDKRIKMIRHKQNMGLMWTRRTGYMAAKGDFITFCDSDDHLPLDALENLYTKALETGADIICGNFVRVSVDKKEIIKQNELRYGNKPEYVYKALLRKEFQHNLCGKLFKTSLLQNYVYQTYEHMTNGEDGCLFYQIVQHVNKVEVIDSSVYYYVQNLESSTQKRLNENAINSICILNKTRVQVLSAYPELKKDLIKCVTNILCSLYAGGYHHDANLHKHIHENGLEDYVSIGKIVKYLDYGSYFRTYINNVIRPLIKSGRL